MNDNNVCDLKFKSNIKKLSNEIKDNEPLEEKVKKFFNCDLITLYNTVFSNVNDRIGVVAQTLRNFDYDNKDKIISFLITFYDFYEDELVVDTKNIIATISKKETISDSFVISLFKVQAILSQKVKANINTKVYCDVIVNLIFIISGLIKIKNTFEDDPTIMKMIHYSYPNILNVMCGFIENDVNDFLNEITSRNNVMLFTDLSRDKGIRKFIYKIFSYANSFEPFTKQFLGENKCVDALLSGIKNEYALNPETDCSAFVEEIKLVLIVQIVLNSSEEDVDNILNTIMLFKKNLNASFIHEMLSIAFADKEKLASVLAQEETSIPSEPVEDLVVKRHTMKIIEMIITLYNSTEDSNIPSDILISLSNIFSNNSSIYTKVAERSDFIPDVLGNLFKANDEAISMIVMFFMSIPDKMTKEISAIISSLPQSIENHSSSRILRSLRNFYQMHGEVISSSVNRDFITITYQTLNNIINNKKYYDQDSIIALIDFIPTIFERENDIINYISELKINKLFPVLAEIDCPIAYSLARVSIDIEFEQSELDRVIEMIYERYKKIIHDVTQSSKTISINSIITAMNEMTEIISVVEKYIIQCHSENKRPYMKEIEEMLSSIMEMGYDFNTKAIIIENFNDGIAMQISSYVKNILKLYVDQKIKFKVAKKIISNTVLFLSYISTNSFILEIIKIIIDTSLRVDIKTPNTEISPKLNKNDFKIAYINKFTVSSNGIKDYEKCFNLVSNINLIHPELLIILISTLRKAKKFISTFLDLITFLAKLSSHNSVELLRSFALKKVLHIAIDYIEEDTITKAIIEFIKSLVYYLSHRDIELISNFILFNLHNKQYDKFTYDLLQCLSSRIPSANGVNLVPFSSVVNAVNRVIIDDIIYHNEGSHFTIYQTLTFSNFNADFLGSKIITLLSLDMKLGSVDQNLSFILDKGEILIYRNEIQVTLPQFKLTDYAKMNELTNFVYDFDKENLNINLTINNLKVISFANDFVHLLSSKAGKNNEINFRASIGYDKKSPNELNVSSFTVIPTVMLNYILFYNDNISQENLLMLNANSINTSMNGSCLNSQNRVRLFTKTVYDQIYSYKLIGRKGEKDYQDFEKKNIIAEIVVDDKIKELCTLVSNGVLFSSSNEIVDYNHWNLFSSLCDIRVVMGIIAIMTVTTSSVILNGCVDLIHCIVLWSYDVASAIISINEGEMLNHIAMALAKNSEILSKEAIETFFKTSFANENEEYSIPIYPQFFIKTLLNYFTFLMQTNENKKFIFSKVNEYILENSHCALLYSTKVEIYEKILTIILSGECDKEILQSALEIISKISNVIVKPPIAVKAPDKVLATKVIEETRNIFTLVFKNNLTDISSNHGAEEIISSIYKSFDPLLASVIFETVKILDDNQQKLIKAYASNSYLKSPSHELFRKDEGERNKTIRGIITGDDKRNDEEERNNIVEICSDDCPLCTFIKTQLSIIIETEIMFNNQHKAVSKFFAEAYTKCFNDNFLQNILCNFSYSFSYYLSHRENIDRIRGKFLLREDSILNEEIDRTNPEERKCKDLLSNVYNSTLVKIDGMLNTWLSNGKSIYIRGKNLLSKIFFNSTSGDEISTISNCLVFNEMNYTESLCLVGKKCLMIIANLFIDSEGIVYKVSSHIKKSYWIVDNSEEILKTFLDNRAEEKNLSLPKFCRNIYNISKFVIYYSDITEMYRRQFLHHENTLEIFTCYNKSTLISFPILTFSRIMSTITSKIIDQLPQSHVFFRAKHPDKKAQNSSTSISSLISTYQSQWIDGVISNFNYLMILNTISGRTYNDISTYNIFPWTLINFEDKFDIESQSNYRDLSYPIYAQEEKQRENLGTKYSLLEEEDCKYHCGSHYSTPGFVAYYLVRMKPFSIYNAEIQNDVFDTPDRLFFNIENLSKVSEKYQELINDILTIPEALVNVNDFNLGKGQNGVIINDVLLPKWSSSSPRCFVIMMKKCLESVVVSEKLNEWIDLIFGYRQSGEKGVERYNILRPVCRKLDLSKVDKEDIEFKLKEIVEMGHSPVELFTKSHSKREKCYSNSSNSFSCHKTFLDNLSCVKTKCEISFSEITEIKGYKEECYRGNYGGLSSCNRNFGNNINTTDISNGHKIYLSCTRECVLIPPSNVNYIDYSDQSKFSFRIVKPFKKVAFEFVLGSSRIKSICVGSDDDIYIVFSNGIIEKYRIVKGDSTDLAEHQTNKKGGGIFKIFTKKASTRLPTKENKNKTNSNRPIKRTKTITKLALPLKHSHNDVSEMNEHNSFYDIKKGNPEISPKSIYLSEIPLKSYAVLSLYSTSAGKAFIKAKSKSTTTHTPYIVLINQTTSLLGRVSSRHTSIKISSSHSLLVCSSSTSAFILDSITLDLNYIILLPSPMTNVFLDSSFGDILILSSTENYSTLSLYSLNGVLIARRSFNTKITTAITHSVNDNELLIIASDTKGSVHIYKLNPCGIASYRLRYNSKYWLKNNKGNIDKGRIESIKEVKSRISNITSITVSSDGKEIIVGGDKGIEAINYDNMPVRRSCTKCGHGLGGSKTQCSICKRKACQNCKFEMVVKEVSIREKKVVCDECYREKVETMFYDI